LGERILIEVGTGRQTRRMSLPGMLSFNQRLGAELLATSQNEKRSTMAYAYATAVLAVEDAIRVQIYFKSNSSD